ncbi:MAG TPA: hypothetical protein VKM56_02465, partial [Verrucomicrobiae bacterium]|nr:hypothetical protein [Verrucomicrobiae bacterium]
MTGAIELEGDSLLPSNGRGPDREEMKRASMRVFVALGVLLAWQSSAAAPERWSDARLPVKDGLEVWLDASRQNAARLAKQLPGLNEGRPLDIWFDGSGNQINVVQRIPELRPHFKMGSGGAFVRFDGKDDSLAAAGLHRTFTNTTIFVVAAPRSNIGNFPALLAFNATGRNDYQSGLNLDLGPSPSAAFSVLNAEGGGFQGVRN